MNKKIKPFFYLPVFALASCASKQDLNVVEYDVRKLKTESETIKSQSAVSYADIQQVRDDVLRLQGRLEEMTHKATESARSNEKSFSHLGTQDSLLLHRAGDLDARLLKIEQYLGLGKEADQPPVLLSRQKDSVKVDTASGTLTDAALLNAGMEKLKQNSYGAARESFSALLRAYPKSELAADAQFFIAESYFGEKWYEKAILEYQVVISRYTKSQKRPAALYKQARSFEITGDATSAKLRYTNLVNVYPKSVEAGLAKKKLR
ncbi:MAG: tol-pal system protein YbgF [Chlorobium sp.]